MTLREKAVLELDVNEDTTLVFEMRENMDATGSISKNFLMSNRGQYLRKVYDIGSDILPDEVAEDTDFENLQGYHVDGGAGEYTETLSFDNSLGDDVEQWGDGSSDPTDPADRTFYDATGSYPTSQKHIFLYHVGQTPTDSTGRARLHLGEWTDGSYSDRAGVFEAPLPVAIGEATAERSADSTAIEGTLELTWTATFPDVDILGAAEETLENLGDMILD